jgi:hypothetical protein
LFSNKGWYRDCSVIPHTTDVDLAMWINEYDKNIKEHFLKNNEVRLAMSLGLIREGYELRLYSKTAKTFDLFFMYKHNETFQWNGYHTQKHIYRYVLKNRQLISNLVFLMSLNNFWE